METIGSKIYALEREMKYLINKAKNFRPKPKVKKENATSKANETDADSAKKTNETKTEESEKTRESEDDKEATVEVEDDDSDTTTTAPESQGMWKTWRSLLVPMFFCLIVVSFWFVCAAVSYKYMVEGWLNVSLSLSLCGSSLV